MKKNKIKYIIKTINISLLCFFLFVSCTGNFEDLNTHPTDVYPGDMTEIEEVGSLFPSMLYLLNPTQENSSQHIEQMVGGQYGGYFATTSSWENTNFGTFNPSAVWIDKPFGDMFTEFYPNYLSIKEATKSSGYIYAWANIIRVGVMLRVTDMYGPIPYSEMGKGAFAVPYDDVQSIYHQMIEDLDNSVSVLSAFIQENANAKLPIAEYDLIYKGDYNKWIRYANSLKLRMAVRIAAVDLDYAKQAMKEAIEGGVIELNSDNAFLPTNDNPFRKASIDWKDLAINATLSAYMDGYKDPRINSYMTKTLLGYCGVRMGISNIDDQGTYQENYSKVTFEKNSPLPVYYAAETYFLKAEAALQGWIEGGETAAKEYYEQGIKTSMEQYNVSIGNYLLSTDFPQGYTDPGNNSYSVKFTNPPTVSWEDGSNKLEKIITQKWIANYPLGIEAWCDFRRTGYPQIITAVDNLSSSAYIGSIDSKRMVRRLPYPTSEKSSNSTNVEHAINVLLGGPDTGATDLWWAKKD